MSFYDLSQAAKWRYAPGRAVALPYARPFLIAHACEDTFEVVVTDLDLYPQRKSPRLQGYDYGQAGAYFVTLCCYQRLSFFGNIVDEKMHLNDTGILAEQCWQAIPVHFPNVELDDWMIMPNHMHGILLLTDTVAVSDKPSNSPVCVRLSSIINSYKGAVTRAERQRCSMPELRIWQPRYHDHIIRNERDLNRIREYVQTNPAQWQTDTFYSG